MADSNKLHQEASLPGLHQQFLEALLLRKAGQTPMLPGKYSESLALEKRVILDRFLCCSLVVDISVLKMHSFCLLTSMELTLIPDCSLLYLHSNDMNSLKSVFKKKKRVIAINIIVIKKTRIKSVCNRQDSRHAELLLER